jgi:flavin-dependent dehydrogenase
MHRADLLSALAAAVPAERVHLGHLLTDVVDRGDRVEARFANGACAEVDVLVGADGIHSRVRNALFGPDEPRFTGCVAFRGLVPSERLRGLALEVTSQVWMGPGRHFVHHFVGGGRLVNLVAVVEQDTWTSESWTERGEVADALAAFEGWHPQVRTILGSVDETFIWGLFDRPPLERWSEGRVTLLGDACHPMLPFMAQGAAQAIEDGPPWLPVWPEPMLMSRLRCVATNSCDGRERLGCRRCRWPTRRASICPTARPSVSATSRCPRSRPIGLRRRRLDLPTRRRLPRTPVGRDNGL